MSRPPEPLFLARRTYRRRRLGDAAVFLPIVGWVLLLLPILWSENASTGAGLIYIFTIWAVLIAVVAPISIRLMASLREGDAQRATRSERKDEGDAGRTG